MEDSAREIEAELKKLTPDEYAQLASPPADQEADEIGRLLAQAETLTDEDVDNILAAVAEASPATEEELASEVRRALARAQARPEKEVAERIRRGQLRGLGLPLELLRTLRGLSPEELVDALIERLGLEAGKRRKLRRYYEELEAGLLDPATVDGRVFNVLAERLRVGFGDVFAVPQKTQLTSSFTLAAFADQRRQRLEPSRLTSAEPGSREWDEVDDLFRGGP
jgi:hypothetical protein